MPKRPATQNQTDLAKARAKLSAAFQLQDAAWRLIQAVERREQQQHASTGKTDRSVAASRRRRKAAKR